MSSRSCPQGRNQHDGPFDGLLVVPPCIKVSTGPLLGPALLVSAARNAGLACETLDLNHRFLKERGVVNARYQRKVWGDHDGPREPLRDAERWWGALGDVRALTSHRAVDEAIKRAQNSPQHEWLRAQIASFPDARVFGLSVMHEGQALPALCIARLLRERFPSSRLIFGGAHVTAIGGTIALDAGFCAYCDGYVLGAAERTWCDLLVPTKSGRGLPNECLVAGNGDTVRALALPDTVPSFSNLGVYASEQLTLPAQVSRGCAYGACAFCSYPAVEGEYVLTLGSVLALGRCAGQDAGRGCFI